MRITATTDHTDWTPIRQQRNRLLEMTDRFMLPDFPITTAERDETAGYRAALRDLLSVTQNPASVAWPQLPAVVLAHLPPSGRAMPPQL